MSDGDTIDLHGERLARIEGGKTAPDSRALLKRARQGERSAREILADALDVVRQLERIVAEEDQLAENAAAAEARRSFRVVT